MPVLVAFIDCPKCSGVFEGAWPGDEAVQQDMTEPPVTWQQCPLCGAKFEAEYPGWTFFTEAG